MGKDEMNNDEIEIDLLQLFRALRKRIWVILAAMVLCGGVAGAFSKLVLMPQYTSTAMMYILSKETTLTSLADLQIGSQLTQDYKIIVTSRPVLEDVIQKLQLDMTYKELKEKVVIDNPKDTRILSIAVTDPDPVLAKDLVDTIANTSSDYIGDIMEMIPPKMIESGVVPTQKTSPSNSKNAILGALAGMVLVCGVTVAEVLMNDTVQSEDDVERYLGISVLASVPLREGEESEQKDKKKKKRSRSGKQKNAADQKGGR